MNEPANIDELMRLQGEMFVQGAYASILNRKVDPQGFQFYLDRLNSGVGKLQIVREIATSAEGSLARSELRGLRRALRLQRLLSLPILGPLIGRFLSVEDNSPASMRVRALEQKAFVLENALAGARASDDRINGRLEELNNQLLQTEKELLAEFSRRFEEMSTRHELFETLHAKQMSLHSEEMSRRFEELKSRYEALETLQAAANRENASNLEGQRLALARVAEDLRNVIANSLQGVIVDLEAIRDDQKRSHASFNAQLLDTLESSQISFTRLEAQIAAIQSRLKLT